MMDLIQPNIKIIFSTVKELDDYYKQKNVEDDKQQIEEEAKPGEVDKR